MPAITAIAISQQILWGRIERKRFYYLLGRPLCGWMFRYVEVDDSPAIMRQYDECEQYFEGRRWHHKEVDGGKFFQVQIEERSPRSRGQSLSVRFVLFHGRFSDFNPQLVKFGNYAWLSKE